MSIYLFKVELFFASKNEIVNDISEYMLSLIPNELKTYLSFDISYLVNRDINVFNDYTHLNF